MTGEMKRGWTPGLFKPVGMFHWWREWHSHTRWLVVINTCRAEPFVLCTGKTSAWLEVAGYYIGHIQNEFCGLAALELWFGESTHNLVVVSGEAVGSRRKT